VLGVSPLGKRQLGNKPKEFSNLAWISMIIASGFGLTLVFWGIAEPAAFYSDWWGTPFNQVANTPAAAKLALSASLYHWGLHPWAIYGMTGLAVAYGYYNQALPLKLSSAFSPILRYRWGNLIAVNIDSLAVIASVLGVATTLGLGARQVGKALAYLYGVPNSIYSQSLFIVIISVALLLVLHKGLHNGIKALSRVNLFLLMLFLVAIFTFADINRLLGHLVNTPIHYLKNVIGLSMWDGRVDLKFFHGWTIFYWLWWFSWAPFMGVFLAKISRGRSVRECVFAFIILPTLFTSVWFSVLGGLSLDQIIQGVDSVLVPRLSPSTAIFQMLGQLPLGQYLSFSAMVLVLLCLVTTADSSLYVVMTLTQLTGTSSRSKGSQFWTLVLGGLAIGLLLIGGKQALETVQSASLLIGVLMSILLMVSSVFLVINLKQEKV
jgi:BCCT family betaine/carnitine transporter